MINLIHYFTKHIYAYMCVCVCVSQMKFQTKSVREECSCMKFSHPTSRKMRIIFCRKILYG